MRLSFDALFSLDYATAKRIDRLGRDNPVRPPRAAAWAMAVGLAALVLWLGWLSWTGRSAQQDAQTSEEIR